MLSQDETIGDTTSTINIVIAECNDGYLNSIRIPSIKPEHAIQAIEKATTAPVEQGAVGAGKGMVCFGYKGGIGSTSRVVVWEKLIYTVGCLVLSNFGKSEEALFLSTPDNAHNETPDGSIIIILATDAPLYDRQLKRLARRAGLGLGRVGSTMANGSGDIAIAFTTANRISHERHTILENMTFLRDDHPLMNLLFQAAVATTEEAIMNSLKFAETTAGRKGRIIKKAPL